MSPKCQGNFHFRKAFPKNHKGINVTKHPRNFKDHAHSYTVKVVNSRDHLI